MDNFDRYGFSGWPSPSKAQRVAASLDPKHLRKPVELALLGGLSQRDRQAGFRVYLRPFLPYFKQSSRGLVV